MSNQENNENFESNDCVHNLFEEQAKKTPFADAIVFGNEKITYSELNDKADRLAAYLRSLGVGPEILVGIMLERSIDLIVCLFAVLKAGGGYVPLDPKYPLNRLNFMLNDSRVKILLTDSKQLGSITLPTATRSILIDEIKENGLYAEEDLKVKNAGPANVAYVIYTSGSTGQPKGVIIEHHSTVTFLKWVGEIFSRQELAGVLAATSICFDLSIFEIFAPLSYGGKVILAENVLELPSLSDSFDITLINTVPSAMTALLDLNPLLDSISVVNLAGEPLTYNLVRKVYSNKNVKRVFNLYGPTEDTTYSTYFFVPREIETDPPIGFPVKNTQIHILNDKLQTVAGKDGEIYISGEGLSRGYLNRVELTAERFIEHNLESGKNIRMYKTGDIGRLLPDGSIQYIGRQDQQVKIRGYRVELGEIEAVLAAHEQVQSCVVTLVTHPKTNEKHITAYVLPESGSNIDLVVIKQEMKNKLPSFMLPGYYVKLKNLPLLPNGKVNRRALPAPNYKIINPEKTKKYDRKSKLENELCQLYAEILGIEAVGREDNFFEMGGHSLMATQLVSRIKKQYQIDFPLQKIFELPFVFQVAGFVKDNLKTPLLSELSKNPRKRKNSLLSFTQQGFWLFEKLFPDNTANNIPIAIQLKGEIDIAILEKCLNRLIERHQILCAYFSEKDGKPFQHIKFDFNIELKVQDWQINSNIISDNEIKKLVLAESQHPFSLNCPPLFRTQLIKVDSQEHILVLVLHHIIADGWSIDVIIREIIDCYEEFCSDSKSPYQIPIKQYSDFTYLQHSTLLIDGYNDQIEYWRQQLNFVAPLNIPTDLPRPTIITHKGENCSLTLSPKLTGALKILAKRNNVTLFMLLLASFKTLLHRYSDQEDICVGVPIAGRNKTEFENLVGCFINTLAMRTDLSGDPSFEDLLKLVRTTTLEAFSHQEVPFEILLEKLQFQRNANRAPVFQIMFNMLNYERQRQNLKMNNISVNVFEYLETASKYDLMLYARNKDAELELILTYNTQLFREQTATRILSDLHGLLQNIIDNPKQRLSSIAFSKKNASKFQKLRKVRPKNDFTEFFQSDIEQSINRRFEQQVSKFPDKIALFTEENKLTYKELNNLANQIAHSITDLDDNESQRVALLFNQNCSMIAAILGVLKTGKAYVPLEPSQPLERLKFVNDNSQVKALITNSENVPLANLISKGKLPVINIDKMDKSIFSANPDLDFSHYQPAYILYTSGSTGLPKGVVQSHQNLLHHIRIYTNNLHINHTDRLTLLSSYCFDASVMDIFGSLLNGATLFPFDLRQKGFDDFYTFITAQKISIYHSTPTVYRYFVRNLPNKTKFSHLRLIVLGGEEVLKNDFHLFQQHFSSKCILVNGLGPTESTLALQFFSDKKTELKFDTVPVGFPVENTKVTLLNKSEEQVAIYGKGEIIISSRHVALGYWQQEELTVKVFIAHPIDISLKTYKTGDIGRLLPDGSIQYIGRQDQQVKIRGYRVELGEIEAVLAAHEQVQSCVVTLVTHPKTNEKHITAYVLIKNDSDIQSEKISKWLEDKLPNYMLPNLYVQLTNLPLMPNGKIDRKSLPGPIFNDKEIGKATKKDGNSILENELCQLYAEILGIEAVGREDNFFEMGGHSLMATQLVSRIKKQYQIDFPLQKIFELPTVAEIATSIEAFLLGNDEIKTNSFKKSKYKNLIPASYAQERFWFLNKSNPKIAFSKMRRNLRIDGNLNTEALERSLNSLVKKHEILRTNFVYEEKKLYQVLHPELKLKLDIVDISEFSQVKKDTMVKETNKRLSNLPFDLTTDHLIHLELIKFNKTEYVLFLVLHHIICDAASMSIILKELWDLYRHFSKPGNSTDSVIHNSDLQFSDYVLWQQEWLKGDLLENQIKYWADELKDAPLNLKMPIVKSSSNKIKHKGANLNLTVKSALRKKLLNLSRLEGTTLYIVLLSAFKAALYNWTGEKDIVIGSPESGRDREETRNMLGLFVNTLIIRTKLPHSMNYKELINETKNNLLKTYSYRHVPIMRLIERIRKMSDMSDMALYQVVFNYQSFQPSSYKVEGLEIKNEEIKVEISRFNLTIFVLDKDDKLNLSVLYREDLFNTKIIDKLLKLYYSILIGMTENLENCVKIEASKLEGSNI
jgi:amino acid adenylation domain-containing protein